VPVFLIGIFDKPSNLRQNNKRGSTSPRSGREQGRASATGPKGEQRELRILLPGAPIKKAGRRAGFFDWYIRQAVEPATKQQARFDEPASAGESGELKRVVERSVGA